MSILRYQNVNTSNIFSSPSVSDKSIQSFVTEDNLVEVGDKLRFCD